MNLRVFARILAVALFAVFSLRVSAAELKPRIVVLTDVSTWETDDSESLVRLLVHADLLEIEGLVFTTGWSLETTRDDFMELIREPINAYEKDLPNLRKRSRQEGHLADESRQTIGYWPSAMLLRSATMFGSRKRGMEFIGKDNNSPGSDLIIRLADEADARPLWVLGWGGGNTLAQAIWRVQQERTPEQLRTFLGKVRFYSITDQDRGYQKGTPFDTSSHQWMRREFSKDLFFIWDEGAWMFQNGTGKQKWDDYAAHIQGHGHLGALYPKYKYGVEGDTPSFLYVLPNGLNDPERPGHGGWGGFYVRGIGPDEKTEAWVNQRGLPAHETARKHFEHFYPAMFNSFAARMDWAHSGTGNREPVVVVNGDRSRTILKLAPAPGASVAFDASASTDPEGDALAFSWWILPGVGDYTQPIALTGTNASRVSFIVPADAVGKSFHIVCEVTDTGSPKLTGYRRVVVEAAAAKETK